MMIRASLSLIAGGLVAGSVWVNALWLQEGRHPAPLFFAAPAAAPSAAGPVLADRKPAVASPGRASPPVSPSPRLTGEGLALLQRALFEMGFYDGPVDGIDGPRTHFAIMGYQKAHGLEATAIADEGLLAHARKANGRGLAATAPEPIPVERSATAERNLRGPDSNSL